jgi:hypothetical protein
VRLGGITERERGFKSLPVGRKGGEGGELASSPRRLCNHRQSQACSGESIHGSPTLLSGVYSENGIHGSPTHISGVYSENGIHGSPTLLSGCTRRMVVSTVPLPSSQGCTRRMVSTVPPTLLSGVYSENRPLFLFQGAVSILRSPLLQRVI